MSIRGTLTLAAATALTMALLLLAPASALATTGVHIRIGDFEFGDFTCEGYVCTGVADGAVTGNLGPGSIHWDMVTTFFDGWDSDCNHVDEVGTFTFADGSITEVSHHTDCRVHGIRIKTTFEVIGGTGEYAGATGSGIEVGGGNQFTYNGTIELTSS